MLDKIYCTFLSKRLLLLRGALIKVRGREARKYAAIRLGLIPSFLSRSHPTHFLSTH